MKQNFCRWKKTLTNEKAKLTKHKLKRRLKPIKDESGEGEAPHYNRQKTNPTTKQIYQRAGFVFSRQRLTVCVTGLWVGRWFTRQAEKCSGRWKCSKSRTVPTSPVHALLAGVLIRADRLLPCYSTYSNIAYHFKYFLTQITFYGRW